MKCLLNKTKLCTRCKQTKPVSKFQKRGKGYQPHCKLCHRANCADHYKRNKAVYKNRAAAFKLSMVVWFNEIKSKLKCSRCPETHQSTFDFHHKDPSTKLETVSNLVARGKSREIILAEIAKCEVLCANCHRKLHYNSSFV